MGFERDLAELERAIERLNTEYAAFLYGTSVKAPVESRRQVEALLRRLCGVEMEAATERYRLATLQGHFNTLAERWERQQAEKEDGKRPGFYSAFSGAAVRPTGAGPRPSQTAVKRGPNEGPPASVQKAQPPSPGRELFERYLGAKRAHGEDVSGYEYRQFTENLERERQKVRQRIGTDDFDLDVKDSDGHVRLVARRRKPAGGR
ncbi:MAG: MXAN_5187 C-terminal domain-containing protein [Thermoanaerobaculia bacterium]